MGSGNHLNPTKTKQIDNAKFNQFIEIFSNAIQAIIKECMKSYKFDETYKAVVLADMGNSTYKIKINNAEYTVKCRSRKLNIGEPEWVTVPRGNWKELFIR